MAITNDQLTQARIDGTGVFDLLMQATKAHVNEEFQKNRITGSDYATVYLGSLQTSLQIASSFVLERDIRDLERQRLEIELEKLEVEKDRLAAEVLLTQAQVALTNKQSLKIDSEIDQIDAQIQLVGQQRLNLVAEAAIIPKQGQKIDADIALSGQQRTNLIAEALNIPKEGQKIDAEKNLIQQQDANLVLEADNIPLQGLVLVAQECKLKGEFDLLVTQVTKTQAETTLLTQKVATEKAQVSGTGVATDSVIGRQMSLYQAQANGFTRDAEQKAAKLMLDTWNVRRTTDEGTVADGTNQLNDATIGRFVSKLLQGINA